VPTPIPTSLTVGLVANISFGAVFEYDNISDVDDTQRLVLRQAMVDSYDRVSSIDLVQIVAITTAGSGGRRRLLRRALLSVDIEVEFSIQVALAGELDPTVLEGTVTSELVSLFNETDSDGESAFEEAAESVAQEQNVTAPTLDKKATASDIVETVAVTVVEILSLSPTVSPTTPAPSLPPSPQPTAVPTPAPGDKSDDDGNFFTSSGGVAVLVIVGIIVVAIVVYMYMLWKQKEEDKEGQWGPQEQPEPSIQMQRKSGAAAPHHELARVVAAAESEARKTQQEMNKFLRRTGLGRYVDNFHDFGLESLHDLMDADIVNRESLRAEIGMSPREIDAFYYALEEQKGKTTPDSPLALH